MTDGCKEQQYPSSLAPDWGNVKCGLIPSHLPQDSLRLHACSISFSSWLISYSSFISPGGTSLKIAFIQTLISGSAAGEHNLREFPSFKRAVCLSGQEWRACRGVGVVQMGPHGQRSKHTQNLCGGVVYRTGF